jgi:hypothetical protein
LRSQTTQFFHNKGCWMIAAIVKMGQSKKPQQCIMDYEHATIQQNIWDIVQHHSEDLFMWLCTNSQSHKTRTWMTWETEHSTTIASFWANVDFHHQLGHTKNISRNSTDSTSRIRLRTLQDTEGVSTS